MDNSITARLTDWKVDEKWIRAVREAVFTFEQKVPADLDFDGSDTACRHVLAFDGEIPVGTARLGPGGRIGRMAVLATHRRRGVGKVLMNLLLELAKENGTTELHLHSQVQANPFYESFGFTAQGEEFSEAGIAHVLMTKRISSAH